MDPLRECYKILELDPSATSEEIKAAYLDLVKVWHPDRYSGDSPRLRRRAEEKLKAINRAFEMLRGGEGGLPAEKFETPALKPFSFAASRGHFGYVNPEGKVVIPPEFGAAREFREGLAAVMFSSKWGFIDPAGRIVIHPLYEQCADFSEGLAAVRWRGRWGYIDRAGAFAIKPRYDAAEAFGGGWARVRIGERWGKVNRAGEAFFTEPKGLSTGG